MEREIYKVIPHTNGKYSISNRGNVKNNASGKMTALFEYHNGYMGVVLYVDGKHFNRRIHRLVADAFIPNECGEPYVNHKDENKKNNSVENLEWCSSEYNNNYGTRNKRITKTLSKPVEQYTVDGKYIKTYSSLCEASNAINPKDKGSGISRVCRGEQKTYKGYKWRYSI